VTAFYATLDPATRRLTYTTAGHNPPRLVRRGQVISLEEDGALPMGIFEGQSFRETTRTLEPGDLLLLYTDGVTEAMAPPDTSGARDLFGTDRLDALLLDSAGGSAQACVDRIRDAVGRFTGAAGPPRDDQTLIAIRCL
jgi:sigma-B regulation protein RsbU (phosphoserine phosphatase)